MEHLYILCKKEFTTEKRSVKVQEKGLETLIESVDELYM